MMICFSFHLLTWNYPYLLMVSHVETVLRIKSIVAFHSTWPTLTLFGLRFLTSDYFVGRLSINSQYSLNSTKIIMCSKRMGIVVIFSLSFDFLVSWTWKCSWTWKTKRVWMALEDQIHTGLHLECSIHVNTYPMIPIVPQVLLNHHLIYWRLSTYLG